MIQNIKFKTVENLPQENETANNARAQCYKTFYNRKIQIFIRAGFCPWQTFPVVCTAKLFTAVIYVFL
jgi:hypothetical protein